MRRSALMLAPVLALGLVAGCSQGKSNDFHPGGDAGQGSTDSTPDDMGSDLNGNNNDSHNSGDLASCVVGSWEAGDAALQTLGMNDASEFGPGATVDFVWTFDQNGDANWNLAVSGSSQGTAIDVTIDFNGNWKVSGSRMTLSLPDVSGSMTYSAGGVQQSQDITAADIGMDSSDLTNLQSTVSCTSSTLTVTDDGDPTPISLTRQ